MAIPELVAHKGIKLTLARDDVNIHFPPSFCPCNRDLLHTPSQTVPNGVYGAVARLNSACDNLKRYSPYIVHHPRAPLAPVLAVDVLPPSINRADTTFSASVLFPHTCSVASPTSVQNKVVDNSPGIPPCTSIHPSPLNQQH